MPVLDGQGWADRGLFRSHFRVWAECQLAGALEMQFPRASQALSRFTVLDLTRVRSGPTAVRQLADWGANVIQIDALLEDGGGEQHGGSRQGADFQNLHRNKRAMALNLKDPRGLEVFMRLAAKADVVV